jgi:hypothetical protein
MKKFLIVSAILLVAASTPVSASQSSLHAPNNVPWLVSGNSCLDDIDARYKSFQMLPCWAEGRD